MDKFKEKFSQLFSGESGSVFKGMLTLLMGASLSRIVGLASIPILTRIYSPEDYGMLALYTSFTAILAPILTLRYVQAIPLPKTDAMAFNLFSVCFKLILAGSLVAALVLLLFGEAILGWFNMQALAPWWWLIILGAAGTALYELFSLWATRKKQYPTIAATQFSQSIVGNVAKIGLGLLAIKPAGLIIGQFLSQSAGVASFIKADHRSFKTYLSKVKNQKEKFAFKYYQNFVWFRLPSQFLMVLSVQAPVMMAAALYDKEVTGQLSLAMMVVSLPVSLIGSAMSKAYYAEIASIGKKDLKKIQRITLNVQKKLLAIGFPIAVIACLLSEQSFRMLFGLEWALAGKYAALLAPFIFFQFTSSPLMEIINILGSQLLYLILHSLRITGLFVLFTIVQHFKVEDEYFVMAISGYLSLFYLSASLLVFAMLSKEVKKSEI